MMYFPKIPGLGSKLITIFYPLSTIFFSLRIPCVEPSPLPQALSAPIPNEEYPDPEPCYGNCSWVLDPSVIYDNGVYWRFSTSGNIAVASAPGISGPWTYRGALLPNGTSIFLNPKQDIWAPSVTKIGDTFYCLYAVSWMGTQNSTLGVATSKSLAPGTWHDHGAIGLPRHPDYNLIDPSLFAETPTGPHYLTFGSAWHGIYQARLTHEAQLLAWRSTDAAPTPPQNILRNTSAHAAVIEAAVLHKHRRYYYLFFSAGWCCHTLATGLADPADVYRIVLCRAPSATGPFYDRAGKNCLTESGGTTLLAGHGDVYAPGGQDVMLLPDSGRTVLSYHYLRPSVGFANEQKFFGFNYLEWNDGWPVVVAADERVADEGADEC